MHITTIIYSFYYDKVIIKTPCEIKKETDKYYCTKDKRHLKTNIGKPILKHNSNYPYIKIVMIDADEQTLKNELSKWFIDKANKVLEAVE